MRELFGNIVSTFFIEKDCTLDLPNEHFCKRKRGKNFLKSLLMTKFCLLSSEYVGLPNKCPFASPRAFTPWLCPDRFGWISCCNPDPVSTQVQRTVFCLFMKDFIINHIWNVSMWSRALACCAEKWGENWTNVMDAVRLITALVDVIIYEALPKWNI